MARVLVENLPRFVIEKDMDDLFSRYGRVMSMHIKFPSRDTAIAFVEYASAKDAEEASRQLQGLMYHANRLRAELWHSSGEAGPRSKEATQHRIVISHLPPSASTKDVKDLLSALADVLAVEVDRRGSAWATFATHYDLERVVKKLNDVDYRGERLRVKRDEIQHTTTTASSSNSASRSTTAPSPSSSSSRTSRHERGGSSTRSRSRSRSRSTPRYRRRSSSRSPSRHRSSSDRRSRSRSRSPGNRSSSRRYRSRSRSRSR